MRRDRHDSPHRRQRLRVVRAGGVTRSAGTGRLTQLRALLCPAAAGNAHTAVGCESSDTRRSGLAALVAGDRWRRHCQPERGGSSRLAALLCPAAAGKGHAAVGCEASDATIAIGCAADSVPASGAGWPRHWEAPSDERGGSSRLAALLSARLLPARAKQLSAARRATRRSKSAAPPTVPASGAGWPRHWLRRMSGAAQAASLHASPLHPWNNYLFLNLSSYMELNTQGV